jgi:AcrR family transcriptional regulator
MGRKSLAEERREEILAAFERCIGRYGIDVPLERIADEAGVQRSLIRHYLGNREELVAQLIERIAAEYPRRVSELIERERGGGPTGLLDLMFPLGEAEQPREVVPGSGWDALITAVMSAAQGRYPQAKHRLAQMMEQIVEQIADGLAHLFPHAPLDARHEAAYALLCLINSHESLVLLGIGARYSVLARRSAERILEELRVRG